MKARIIISLCFLLFTLTVRSKSPWYMPVEYHKGKVYLLEVSAGGTISDFRYMGSMYNQLNRSLVINPVYGFAYRMQLPGYFSFAPTIYYEKMGTKISDHIEYSLSAQYLSLLLPGEFNRLFYPNSRTKSGFFFSLGPYVTVPLKGEIYYEDYDIELSKANISPYDIGAEIACGVRIATFSSQGATNIRFKLAYSRGFINTYSASEINGQATAVNLPAYLIEGKRFNQMIKLTLSFEMPFEQKETVTFTAGGDGKRTYKKFVNIY